MRNLRKVHPEDFDVELLLTAAREGRLYVETSLDEATTDQLLTQCRQEALDYVSAIDAFAAPEWQPHIKALWWTIINDEAFASSLMIQKGRNRGRLNKYIVTNMVHRLQTQGVYQCNSLLLLHKRLEGVEKKNSFYKNVGTYSLSDEQRRRLRELKDSFSTSLK